MKSNKDKKRKTGVTLKNKKKSMLKESQCRCILCVVFFVFIYISAFWVNNYIISDGKSNEQEQPITVESEYEQEQISASGQPESKENTENQFMVALTFDDGPSKYTMKLLKILEKYNVKATFFTYGVSLKRQDIDVEAILKKMDEVGCDIGNHTMNHSQLDKLKPKEIKREINGVAKIIESYVGHDSLLVRPPYGAGIHSKKVKKNVKYPMICWSLDTLDWKTKSKKKTIKNVMNQVKDGDIILMHDTHKWTVEAMEKIVPKLIKKGYQLVTVTELAEARGVKLKNGKAYFSFRP